MSDVEGIHAYIHGRVQGVLFRDFVKKAARPLSLTGFVRNLPDGETVEVVAEGERDKLEEFLRHLESGPKGANVELVEYEWCPVHHQFQGFSKRQS
ncbi:MAG: acylphosphatase [Dehalococcoidia bacterium]|jgi:acylphosphatase|nr:acylphosphatase [Dehalococcoidia bacterium]MDP7240824.1 acylphosphatase [Dehalococcoidia bacterium]